MAVVNAIHPMDVQEPLPHTPMPPSMPSPPSITATTTATTVIANEIIVDDDDHSDADDDDGLLLKSQNSNGSSKTGSSSGSRTDSDDLVGGDAVDDNGDKDASSSQKQVGQETSASEPANSAVVEHSSFHANNESFDIETNRLGDDGDCNQDKIIVNFETNSQLQNPKKDECRVPTPQISLDGELHRRRPSHHRRHSHASHLSRITPLLHHRDCNPALPTGPTTKLKSRPFNCLTWSSSRIRLAVLGCLASSLVLSVRLYFAYKPTAYLIHSIVVFADMVLIHLFTNCKWLSVSGEITTILFAALYTVTKQTVFELMETTAIAVLCSFHMMGSRKRHREEEGRLLEDLTGLQVEVGEYLVLAQRDGQQHQHQGNGVSPHHGNGSVAAGSRISQILLHTLSSMELDQEEWHSQHTIRLHEGDEIKRKEVGDDEREYRRESKLAMELEQGEITTTTTTVPLTGAEHKIRLDYNDDHLVSSTCKYCGRRRSRPNLHVEFADMDVEISSFRHPSPSTNDPTFSPTCIVSTPSTNNANNHDGRRNISVIAMAGGADDMIDDNNYCDNSDDDDDYHHNNKNNKNVHRLASKSDAATAPTAKTSRFALFFEHFLDGSAGVMYTSFLGLIIDELIHYESDDGKSAY